MARSLRVQFSDAWYHVTSRGNERTSIFRDDHDRGRFLDILEESCWAFQVEVHCYCMMSNHFHFLLNTPLANLSRFMQRFNTSYTVYFNRRHRRSGHLFQGRYKAILVDADAYLLELSRYLHLNPVRLKKLKDIPLGEKVGLLNRYPWSSYPAYIGKKKAPIFLHQDMILGMIGGGAKEGPKLYQRFVLDGLKEAIRSPLQARKAGIVLGTPKFIEWIYEHFIEGKQEDKEFSRLGELLASHTVAEIAQKVADEYSLKPADIVKKRARHREARLMLIELSCRFGVREKSLRAIGEQLGGICVSGMYKSRKRFQDNFERDKLLKKRFDKVASSL
ncbi:MAG: transposase [Candidatus Aureabacteria bacterium]|nr:transposase [Candidatus Auribacterota bacterium]